MAYKVIILYRLYMPSYFLGTFTEYPFRKATDWCATEPILVLCSSGNQSVSPFSNGCFSCSVPAGSGGHWPDVQQR